MYKGNTLKEKEFSRSDFSNNVALTYEPKSENDLLKKKNKCCKTAWIKIHFIICVAVTYHLSGIYHMFTWKSLSWLINNDSEGQFKYS